MGRTCLLKVPGADRIDLIPAEGVQGTTGEAKGFASFREQSSDGAVCLYSQFSIFYLVSLSNGHQ